MLGKHHHRALLRPSPTAPAPLSHRPRPSSSAGVGNVGHFNDGSHNLGSRNVGSRNIGDFNLCALCLGHRLQGFSLAGPPAILPNGTQPARAKSDPTKEEL